MSKNALLGPEKGGEDCLEQQVTLIFRLRPITGSIHREAGIERDVGISDYSIYTVHYTSAMGGWVGRGGGGS